MECNGLGIYCDKYGEKSRGWGCNRTSRTYPCPSAQVYAVVVDTRDVTHNTCQSKPNRSRYSTSASLEDGNCERDNHTYLYFMIGKITMIWSNGGGPSSAVLVLLCSDTDPCNCANPTGSNPV